MLTASGLLFDPHRFIDNWSSSEPSGCSVSSIVPKKWTPLLSSQDTTSILPFLKQELSPCFFHLLGLTAILLPIHFDQHKHVLQ